MAAGVREAQGRGCLSPASVAFWEGFVLFKLPSEADLYFYFFKNCCGTVLSYKRFCLVEYQKYDLLNNGDISLGGGVWRVGGGTKPTL